MFRLAFAVWGLNLLMRFRWIEEVLQPDDPAELDPWHRKLRLIVQRLIEQDGYLLVSLRFARGCTSVSDISGTSC